MKVKGREWDSVKLAGDFPQQPSTEEFQLLYVAVTRGRLAVDISQVGCLNPRPVPAIDDDEEEL